MKPGHLRVAAVQCQFQPTIAGNTLRIVNAIRKAARAHADIVLFPECAVTGYNLDFKDIDPAAVAQALREISETARSCSCNVLVGSPTFERSRLKNSLIHFDRQGRSRFRYDKIHLTARDQRYFTPGNLVAYFLVDDVPCTAIICHERRFPELVRLPVMMGAQIVFHPNAGLDTLRVSRQKRGGRDGIALRAFENQIYYVFANSVGPQGGGLWSAGDSKIVSPGSQVLAIADNQEEAVIHARLNLAEARRSYATEALSQPAFLRQHWKAMLAACRQRLKEGRHPTS